MAAGVELERAAESIRQGAIVAFPTETFFGLAADPFNAAAVNILCGLKSRAATEGIPLILDSEARLGALGVKEPEQAAAACAQLAARFWPGPLTMVFAVDRLHSALAPGVLGPECSVAVRVSSHPAARMLAAAVGGAITATSANPHGAPPARTAAEAGAYYPELFVLPGECLAASAPSTILDVRAVPYRVLRDGAIAAADLAPYLGV